MSFTNEYLSKQLIKIELYLVIGVVTKDDHINRVCHSPSLVIRLTDLYFVWKVIWDNIYIDNIKGYQGSSNTSRFVWHLGEVT